VNHTDKYVVFNRKEFFDWIHSVASGIIGPDEIEAREIPDATVIRGQDTFAPPVLELYANCVTITIQLLRCSHGDLAAIKRLQDIADIFQDRAQESWSMFRKLPD
jgi:hypothetical protein